MLKRSRLLRLAGDEVNVDVGGDRCILLGFAISLGVEIKEIG